MKGLCDRYNRAIDSIVQLVSSSQVTDETLLPLVQHSIFMFSESLHSDTLRGSYDMRLHCIQLYRE